MIRVIRPLALLFALLAIQTSFGQKPADVFGFGESPFVEEASRSDNAPSPSQASSDEQSYAEVPSARVLIFRNAAQMASQRRARLATMRWFGLSNLRPVASQTPGYGTYSPMWVGNHSDDQRWLGVGGTTWR